MLLVGLILVSIIYTCYSIFQSVLKNLDSRFQAHNIYVTRNTARIQIPQLSHHELVDSSRRHVYKALSNLQAPPEESRGRLILNDEAQGVEGPPADRVQRQWH